MAMSSKKYPHLIKQQSNYPYAQNTDVYATESTYDYHQWDVDTIIRVLNVSWDRDYNNVVKFENNAVRDSWVEEHSKNYTLDTPQNILPDSTIRLPIPIDVLQKHNYIAIELPKQPVQYEEDGVRKYGFFINSVRFIAPSTTEVSLTLDYWFTFIDNAQINYLMLERGHAPLAAAASVDDYLKAPLTHNQYLLTPDVDYGNTGETAELLTYFLLNEGESWAVFASSGQTIEQTNWGEINKDSMAMPCIYAPAFGGYGGVDYMAVDTRDMVAFVKNTTEQRPWFFDTIQACFYISKKLVETINDFDFCGVTAHWLKWEQRKIDYLDITDKNKFGYPDKYKSLTKLYTNPYAKIEIANENGEINEVLIENLAQGKLSLSVSLNLIAPFIGVDCNIIGLNSRIDTAIKFSNTRQYTDDLTWLLSGESYKTLRHWDIPQFAVFEDAAWRQKWERYWSNKQAVLSYTNAFDSTAESYNTAYNNAIASADCAYNNAITGASNTKTNAEASNKLAQENSYENALQSYNNTIDNANTARDNGYATNTLSYNNSVKSLDTNNDNTNDSIEANYNNTRDENWAGKENLKTMINKTNIDFNANTEISGTNLLHSASSQRASMTLSNLNTAYATKIAQANFPAQLGQMAANTTAQLTGMNIASPGTFTAAPTSQLYTNLMGAGGDTSTGAISGVAHGQSGGAFTALAGAAFAVGGVVSGITNAVMGVNVTTEMANNTTSMNNALFGMEYGNTDTSATPIPSVIESQISFNNEFNKWNGQIDTENSFAGRNWQVQQDQGTKMKNAAVNASQAQFENSYNLIQGGKPRIINDNGDIVDGEGDTWVGTLERTKTTSTNNQKRTYTAGKEIATSSKTTADANVTRTYNNTKTVAENTKGTANHIAYQIKTNADTIAQNNYDAAETIAKLNKKTAEENAERTRTTATNNNKRTKETAEGAVTNGNAEASLHAPYQHGSVTNAGHAETRPMGLFATLITQSDHAITCTGDYFLRYGYALDQQWNINDNWQPMKYFSYWKANDLWLCCDRAGIEDAGTMLEQIFLKGTTIWSDPEKIGKVSIYENQEQ